VTGYGCPDTAACDSQYFGFYNQIHNAARQFRICANNPDGCNYGIGQNVISYNPDHSCGTTTVNIVNQATASLYHYTPYVPNQAALDNLYGTGNSCSSYGNRNFWRIYTDWFGATLALTYSSTPVSQDYYSNSGKTQNIATTVYTNQTAWMVYRVRNTGSATWTNSGANPVRLGTWPADRVSGFKSPDWVTPTRPATLSEASVAPGQVGTFEFPVVVPATVGIYQERLNVIAEGLTWFPYTGVYFEYRVQNNGTYASSVVSQDYYSDSSKAQRVSTTLVVGQTAWMVYKVKNIGSITWSNAGANPVRLGTWGPERVSAFKSTGWFNDARPAGLTESSVAPGQVGTFEFPVTAPSASGSWQERFNLVSEFKTWFPYNGVYFDYKVQ
jgi:hypothetical protein